MEFRSGSLALAALALLATGCPEPSGVDAGLDAADAVTTDSSDTTALDTTADAVTIAPIRAPDPVAVDTWRYAFVAAPATSDPVAVALDRGDFTYPPEGLRDGVTWESYVSSKAGELPRPAGRGYVYAATQLDVPPGAHLFARADTILTVFANGARQPGDVYGSGRIRVPVVTQPGSNLIVVRGFGRSDPQVQFYSTPDEVVLNLEDVTRPDLVAGESYEQWLGLPVLDVTDAPITDLVARVEPSAQFEASEVSYPGIAAGAVTQLAFRLVPRGPLPPAGTRVTVGLRLESPSLHAIYRRELTIETIATGVTYRRSFRSRIDGSAQYFGVVPPSSFDPARAYALVLSLHGASVEGIGQAQAYSPKDWAYIIAPTNRRPYGFDWEAWGRLDGLEVLDVATQSFRIAPDQVYLTGHSMGGHGTWQLGVLFPGRFATIGPSAGWISFMSYQRTPAPTGVFARSQASSDTLAYMSNLTRRGAYAIHGTADTNVPVSEERNGVAALRMFTSDVQVWEQPGADHWWDGDASPGADCVDWPPLFAFMQAHRLDPMETDFTFTTPSPMTSPAHSFVTITSERDAYADCVVTSARAGDTVTVTTTNVRGMQLAGAALRSRGIVRAMVDGTAFDLPDGVLAVGPQDGKRAGVHGPVNEVFQRPFCFVYDEGGAAAYRRYAAFLTSSWAIIGNGHACTLAVSRVTPAIRAAYNLVYLGVAERTVNTGAIPFHWDATGVALDATRFDAAAMALVFPEGDRLSGLFTAPAGSEYLLFRIQPFTSQFALPDYYVYGAAGRRAAGFFTSEWRFTPGM